MLEQLHDFHEVTIGQVLVSEILLTITMNCFFCFLFLGRFSHHCKSKGEKNEGNEADSEG